MPHFCPFSQIQGMVEVGRDPWGGPSPTQKPKAAAQDHVQVAFEDLQGGRLHNHSGQTVPVLCHSHSKEVLPDLQTGPVFQFVPTAPCPVTGQH